MSHKPLKLIIIAGSKGRVTVKYPYQEPLITPEFRGEIEIDPAKCIGCGACVKACPPNALELLESEKEVILRYFVGRCIFCWRCIDVCPVNAIKGTRNFELATDKHTDLYTLVVHTRATCEICGKPFETTRMQRYIAEKSPVTEEYASICPDCRKRLLAEAVSARRVGISEHKE
jgi:hydrogenase-4 component H